MSDTTTATPAETSAPENFTEYAEWRAAGNEPRATSENTNPSEAARTAAEIVPDSEAEKQAEPEDAEARKGRGGFQRRIDKLTREKFELQAALEAATGAGGKLAGRVDGGTEKAAEAAARPQPQDFDDYDKYIEAVADWKTDQRVNARIAEQVKAQEERIAKEREQQRDVSWQERVKVASAKYADFADVAFSNDTPVSETMREVILESEHGADLAYWLGSHQEDAVRIAHLSPVAAARELGRIEAGFISQATAATSNRQQKSTRAPEPIRPVTPSTKPSPSIMDEAVAGDFRQWEKLRMAQLRKG
jgi:hypothetical protein